MKRFPTDDVTLSALEHALGATLTYDDTVDDDGDPVPRIEGADYSLTQLLDFMSGYDPTQSIPVDGKDYLLDYTGGPLYSERDVIASLVTEVRHCRDSL